MQPKPMPRLMMVRVVLCTFACMAWPVFPAVAQQVASQQTSTPQLPVPNRLGQPIDEANLTTLKGNTHPLAVPEFDGGPAPPNLPLNRMLVVLSRSPEQQTALESLLDQQQDKSSPNYHAWLTPEQFGRQFGPSDDDVQTVTSWLQSYGFTVNRVSKGRTVIEFSGTHAQLQQAFHTEIHKYSVNGKDHWANASDPQIPAALAPVVAGIKTLHTFYKKPQILITGEKFHAKPRPGLPPEFTSSTGLHALAPGDYAKIYNINPLYTASPAINGNGTTIAVVGRSDIFVEDVVDFRNAFVLPSNNPQVVTNGPDPGYPSPGEQFEATLDVTWSGAVAQNAQVIFVTSASTNTTDGVDLSEQYIIDNDLGNVMTESFGGCEASVTAAEATSISSLAQQAAAEGITYMVSSGDSGAEGCDNPDTETRATGPVSVNILASSPYTIAVGGTEFNDEANPSKYWNTSNSASFSSVLSYIPENVWNESCTTGCGQNGGGAIWAGGGGESTFFKKPSWQSGVVPADTNRDLPDVSLTAAGHDPYLLCFQYSCETGDFYGVSGTSASAPSFAGIMALVNQKTGSKQGQANYVLYRLAAGETLSQCNASTTTALPAATCIFNDVTVGNDAVPGELNYGSSSAQYQSAVGYDRATGLGSVNAANLVNEWNTARSVASTTTLTITPSTTVTHGTPLDVTIGVGPTPPATGSPTGDVALIGDYGASPSGETEIVNLTLSSGSATSDNVNQLPGGSYNLDAHYEGDGTFVPSDTTVKITINPEASTETAVALTGTPPNLTSLSTASYGNSVYLQSTISGKSGVGIPTGSVTFIDSVQGSLGSFQLGPTGTAISNNEVFTFNAGSHSITANYSGDNNFAAATSSAVTFKLTQAATTTTLQPPNGPLILGTNPQLNVFITTPSQGLAPTGTATLFSGSTQIGSPVSVNGPAGLGSSGQSSIAYMPVGTLPPGQSTLTVTYSGDSNYVGSASGAVTVTMVRGTNIALTDSASTIQAGQSVTFTAKLTPVQTGGPVITGTVQFQVVNGNNLGTPVTVSNGQAQITTSSLPAGNPAVMATYSGDSNYGTSNTIIFITVNAIPTTTSVTSSSASVYQGQNLTLTAQIVPGQSGGSVPTGTVQFWYTPASGGGPQNALGTPVTVSNGQAQTMPNSLPVGSLTIGATYSGDSTYGASSGTTPETVTPAPTFSITDNPPSIGVTSPGQSVSTILTFTGQNGFTGSTMLSGASCSGLPSESSCSFSPGSVSLSGQTTTQTVTLTVSTTAPSSANIFMRRIIPNNWQPISVLTLGLASFIALLFLAVRYPRHRVTAILAFMVLATIATATSCGGGGGGGGSGGGGGGGNLGTPVGNIYFNVTVTMGGITQTSSINLNVQ